MMFYWFLLSCIVLLFMIPNSNGVFVLQDVLNENPTLKLLTPSPFISENVGSMIRVFNVEAELREFFYEVQSESYPHQTMFYDYLHNASLLNSTSSIDPFLPNPFVHKFVSNQKSIDHGVYYVLSFRFSVINAYHTDGSKNVLS